MPRERPLRVTKSASILLQCGLLRGPGGFEPELASHRRYLYNALSETRGTTLAVSKTAERPSERNGRLRMRGTE